MSYSIFYNKQFIKVSEKDKTFIPMLEAGDNNVYESNNRRARDWQNQPIKGKLIASEAEILAYVNELNDTYKAEDKEYDETQFGWKSGLQIKSRYCTFGNYKGFYVTGMRQALTVEELVSFNVRIVLALSYYTQEALKKKGKAIKPSVDITTTKQLEETIAEWTNFYGSVNFHLTYGSDWGLEKIRKSRQRAKKEKEQVIVDSFYALKDEQGRYFLRKLKYGFSYSYHPTAGKKFITEKEANTFHKRMPANNPWKVVPVQQRTYFYVSK